MSDKLKRGYVKMVGYLSTCVLLDMSSIKGEGTKLEYFVMFLGYVICFTFWDFLINKIWDK